MIRPLNDRVVLKLIQEEETTKGGIILAANAKEKNNFAVVVAVNGFYDDEDNVDLKVGDKVIFDGYSGTTVNVDDEEFVIVKEENILCVIE